MSEPETPSDDLTRPDTLLDDWASLPESHIQWRTGQRLGPFRLKRQLGRGGMGLVWLADQLEPLQREVAIKVMLAANTSPVAEAWFQIERQALAQLSHRAIAQIYDAGRLPDGGLFFAMEYVPGEPLDDYLERHPTSLKDLAELLIEICSGVQHAHQRGLIHRDIKPANLLVSQVDGRAQPKLIDFGVAVSAAGRSASTSTSGDGAGTRAYMAPEQLNPDASGIDARCDVYALGAVLAQCLISEAGGFPEPTDRFVSSTARDHLARSMGMGSDGRTAAAPTDASLKNLPEALRAIALKAMATDREQRYASAAALADDLRRWTQREPVTAMPDTGWYRIGCFLNRHALASTAAALVTVALIAGVVMALYGLGEARLERAEAETARDLAELRRNDAEQLIQFMLGDFADQLRPLGRLDLLDGIGEEALAYLTHQEAGGDPVSALNRARALRTLGEVQVQRQQFDNATLTLAEAAALIDPWSEDRTPASA
ncbi:MAG: serine/threonine-protein kinase, partial [Wenzhouxiangella sp.]